MAGCCEHGIEHLDFKSGRNFCDQLRSCSLVKKDSAPESRFAFRKALQKECRSDSVVLRELPCGPFLPVIDVANSVVLTSV